jgi:hypothetical protein
VCLEGGEGKKKEEEREGGGGQRTRIEANAESRVARVANGRVVAVAACASVGPCRVHAFPSSAISIGVTLAHCWRARHVGARVNASAHSCCTHVVDRVVVPVVTRHSIGHRRTKKANATRARCVEVALVGKRAPSRARLSAAHLLSRGRACGRTGHDGGPTAHTARIARIVGRGSVVVIARGARSQCCSTVAHATAARCGQMAAVGCRARHASTGVHPHARPGAVTDVVRGRRVAVVAAGRRWKRRSHALPLHARCRGVARLRRAPVRSFGWGKWSVTRMR